MLPQCLIQYQISVISFLYLYQESRHVFIKSFFPVLSGLLIFCDFLCDFFLGGQTGDQLIHLLYFFPRLFLQAGFVVGVLFLPAGQILFRVETFLTVGMLFFPTQINLFLQAALVMSVLFLLAGQILFRAEAFLTVSMLFFPTQINLLLIFSKAAF